MASENAAVVCDVEGIHLYHIPELSSAENSTLKPVWEWRGKSEWLCGSVCVESSQRSILYVQEASATHTAIFRMDTSGRDPVITEHHISGGVPAHLTSLEEGDDNRFVMKGRKGIRYTICDGNSEFYTWLVGVGGLAGGFGAKLALPDDSDWDEQEVRFVDFNESTGRIAMGTNRCTPYNKSEGVRLYLADLPP